MRYSADPIILTLDDPAAIAWQAIEPVWDDLPLHPHRRLSEFMASLTAGQRALVAIDWCQKEIRNGGIEQLLGNTTGNLVPYAVDGFHLIGALPYAAILSEVVSILGAEYPASGTARLKAVRRLSADHRQRIRELEERFVALLKEPAHELEHYRGNFVLRHPHDFTRSGGAA